MVFTSSIFVCWFLPLVLLVYHLLPGKTAARNAWLLAASYVFYSWWNPWFVLLMAGVTAVNHACACWMARPGASDRERRAALVLAVALSLGALFIFKYLPFVQTTLNRFVTGVGGSGITVWNIILPVGISFYTFQALSYVVDVYRRDVPPARSLADFACYIAMFPQLVAGPIVRYHTIAAALRERDHSLPVFASGCSLFVLGFAKKVLLANPLGVVADLGFGARAPDAACAWLGLFAFSLQIYFDFSGYSDMAVGLGRMFGFEYMKNFDAPYRAESITEFWRRWHISLSTFLRDYLYIPLGGNRRGVWRTYANIAAVMLLGGIWHGANWTFLAWGAWHAVFLIGERVAGGKPIYQGLPAGCRIAVTMLIVAGSWVWFRAASIEEALTYFRALAGAGVTDASTPLLAARMFTPAALAAVGMAMLALGCRQQAHDWCGTLTWPKAIAVPALFGCALVVLALQSSNPFLYFQF